MESLKENVGFYFRKLLGRLENRRDWRLKQVKQGPGPSTKQSITILSGLSSLSNDFFCGWLADCCPWPLTDGPPVAKNLPILPMLLRSKVLAWLSLTRGAGVLWGLRSFSSVFRVITVIIHTFWRPSRNSKGTNFCEEILWTPQSTAEAVLQ